MIRLLMTGWQRYRGQLDGLLCMLFDYFVDPWSKLEQERLERERERLEQERLERERLERERLEREERLKDFEFEKLLVDCLTV